jgi:hypothetical protein
MFGRRIGAIDGGSGSSAGGLGGFILMARSGLGPVSFSSSHGRRAIRISIVEFIGGCSPMAGVDLTAAGGVPDRSDSEAD